MGDRIRIRQQATGNRQLAEGEEEKAMLRGHDIASRLLDFAGEALRIAASLPRDIAGRHVCQQLIRSATSGANYEEARAAESAADFIHKVGVAMKEVRETSFWLRLIERTQLSKRSVHRLVCESLELAAILGASKRTARRNAERR